jgi:Chaperone of endosialidase
MRDFDLDKVPAASQKSGLMRTNVRSIITAIAFLCVGLLSRVEAVSPAPDGGYPGGNTAEGQNALLGLTTGTYNTAVGLFSLSTLATGQFNTATGAATLLTNTADNNTATGAGALFSNTTGDSNTATGAFALFDNTVGGGNTANGFAALGNNTTSSFNTANGANALLNNTTGGDGNTAIGYQALNNNTTGSGNIVLGAFSGSAITTADQVICIGAGVVGANENNSCFIGEIFGVTSSNGTPVFINSNHKLGTSTSSKRFKEDIKPMDNASETLFSLKPVTFRYKQSIDPDRTGQFGLVAEDVEKINADLVVCDREGKPYSVRYDQVNAMLLNEFLKEHHRVEKLEATVASLVATVKEQAVQLQEVKTEIRINKPAMQVARSNP